MKRSKSPGLTFQERILYQERDICLWVLKVQTNQQIFHCKRERSRGIHIQVFQTWPKVHSWESRLQTSWLQVSSWTKTRAGLPSRHFHWRGHQSKRLARLLQVHAKGTVNTIWWIVSYGKAFLWCMSQSKGRSSRDTEHWMGHATTWSEHPGEAQTQLCRGYYLQSTKTAWRPLVPLACHLQGKFQQPQYRTRTSESIIFNASPLLVFWIGSFVVWAKLLHNDQLRWIGVLALMRNF